MHPADKPRTVWKSGEVNMQLPPSFGTAPITPEQAEEYFRCGLQRRLCSRVSWPCVGGCLLRVEL
jgi:hypothetical protein